MGDNTLAGTGGGAHAVEANITHGPENAVHRRPPSRRADGHGAVRALRRLPQDRVQVDRSLPAPWAGRPGRALAPPPSATPAQPGAVRPALGESVSGGYLPENTEALRPAAQGRVEL